MTMKLGAERGACIWVAVTAAAVAALFGGLLVATPATANPPHDDRTPPDATDVAAELLPVVGAQLVSVAEESLDVTLPDGRVMRFPEGSVITRMPTVVNVVLPTGERVTVPEVSQRPAARVRAASAYYPPVKITHSRAQVETVYKAISNIDNVCRFVPLPYLASIGCGASPAVKNAYTQAHYQKKRVQVSFYHSKRCASCSYSKYAVIK